MTVISPAKISAEFFKDEWMLLFLWQKQITDLRGQKTKVSDEINRVPLKNLNASASTSKKAAALNKYLLLKTISFIWPLK